MTETEALRIGQYVNLYCRGRAEALYHQVEDERDWYVVISPRTEFTKTEQEMKEHATAHLDSPATIYTRINNGHMILMTDIDLLLMAPILGIEPR